MRDTTIFVASRRSLVANRLVKVAVCITAQSLSVYHTLAKKIASRLSAIAHTKCVYHGPKSVYADLHFDMIRLRVLIHTATLP